MFGIDVSEHQGTIDWNKVKNNIDFAILRLGWIGNKNNHTLDKQFEQNYSECKRLGIAVGVYVYNYCNCEETIRAGANWAIDRLKGKSLELPVYIDMEDSSIAGLGKDKLTNMCIDFNTIIEENGLWAGVYANLDWFNNKLHKEELKKRYTCWIAHYTSGIDKYKGEYDIWQNSSSGSVDGISGKVDTNYMYRNLIEAVGNKAVISNTNNVEQEGGEFEVKAWKNGSTDETVYEDLACTKKIGTIYPYEVADCVRIMDGKYVVIYYVTDSKGNVTNRKVGFVKYAGGVK